MAVVKTSVREATFYTRKLKQYFDQLEDADPVSVTDTVLRHGSIRSQLLIMEGVMTVLSSISPTLKRDKKNYYPELKLFEKVLKKYKDYILKFQMGILESPRDKQTEMDMQLKLMTKISTYEEFIDKELAYEPPKAKETDGIDIQGGAVLSLADMKLI